MRFLISLFASLWITIAAAQTNALSGEIYTEDGTPLVYGTVVLLEPADSTMKAFGITNKEGRFDIRNIKNGNYLLQAAFLGYQTHYQPVDVPFPGNNLGRIILKTKPVDVSEVKVVGEYIPLAFRGDTTEYNAAAFQVKPGAPAEELLKKLPGVEVDRAGNIKAMGEDVRRVMVDGKEFFGNDPKVATKNVPADALEKVQIYDRKSEESMFTGIYDGTREKTINLDLKEDKKTGVFGNVAAGGATGGHWLGNGRAYKFTGKTQMAVLGMANNINQSGFSFDDYINFSGGIGSFVHGGGSAQIRITSDGSFPINFGQPIAGLNTSGAGGANFSRSKSQTDRFFVSYLGSGSKKELLQTTNTRNFTGSNSFLQTEELEETDKNQSHRLNFGLRNRIDSSQNMVIDGNLSLSKGDNNRLSLVNTTGGETLFNKQDYLTTGISDRITGDAGGSWIKKIDHGSSVLKISGNISLSQSLIKNDARSETSVWLNNIWQVNKDIRFQDNETGTRNGSLGITFTQKAGKLLYIEPEFRAGITGDHLYRSQGFPLVSEQPVDSISPEFRKNYQWLRPGVSLIRNNTRTRLTLSLQLESSKLSGDLNSKEVSDKNFNFFLPGFMAEYEYKTGRRIMASLTSRVNTPATIQMLPVVNDINPLAIQYGNPYLDPEQSQRLNLHWLIFDQYSFTSLMTTLSGTYIRDKINQDRTIKEDLSFVNRLINVESDYDARGNIDFSTPVRFAGLKVRINLEDRWNRGINLINKAENIYTNHTRRASLTFDNRRKEKWDVSTGIETAWTNSRYSVQNSLNNNYLNISCFGEMRFTPNDSWNFNLNGDYTRYSEKAFGEQVDIPLLNAEINYFFLKNKRGTLTLRGFDLLDKNRILQRLGEMNYLREIRSNSMGRYVMLSFTWRLNQFGGENSGISVKVNRR